MAWIPTAISCEITSGQGNHVCEAERSILFTDRGCRGLIYSSPPEQALEQIASSMVTDIPWHSCGAIVMSYWLVVVMKWNILQLALSQPRYSRIRWVSLICTDLIGDNPLHKINPLRRCRWGNNTPILRELVTENWKYTPYTVRWWLVCWHCRQLNLYHAFYTPPECKGS